MKTIFAFCFILFSLSVFSQQLYTVTATDHQFSPDSLYLNVGDTVVLNSIGYHSMTQVDSLDWVNNNATTNGGFWVGFGSPTSTDTFVVSTSGTHYYNCNPHASMGMKAVIFARATSGIASVSNSNEYVILNLQNGNVLISYQNADQFELYNISGQLIHSSLLDKAVNSKTLSLSLTFGVYIGVFKQDSKVVSSQKFATK